MQSSPEPQRPQANEVWLKPLVTMDRCLGVHPTKWMITIFYSSCIWNIVRHGLQYGYGVVIMGHK